MSEELQKIGLEAVFVLGDFLPKANQYKTSLASINKATYEAVNAMAKSAVSTKDVGDKVADFARRLDDTAGAAKLYNQRLTEMYERKEAVKAQTTMVVKALHDEGRSFSEIANAMGVSQGQLVKVFQDQGWSIREIASATGLATRQVEQLAAAEEEQAKATSKATGYVDRFLIRLALWMTIGALVRSAVQNITNTIKENIKRLYENTEEWKNYQLQVDKLGLSITSVLAPSREFTGILDMLASAAKAAAELIALLGAEMWASIGVMEDYIALAYEWAAALSSGDMERAAELSQEIAEWQGMTSEEAQAKLMQKRAEYLKQFADNMALAGTETVDWAKATEDLTKILQSADEELDRHAKKIRDIHRIYDEEAVQAMVDFSTENQRINDEMNDDIAKITADAADDIARIRADGLKRITELENRARKDTENDERRHQLEMEFARRRYELDRIQSERMYQARRRRLVGEGDVLAIEELDENYRLQREAAEENFRLQMQQAEAMYRLQARIQEESMQRQIQMMRDAMNEQIAERQAARDKEIEEEKAAAAAEEEENRLKRDAALNEARIRRDEELAQERDAHNKRMEAIAEQIRQFAEKYNLEFDAIDAIVERHFGANSVMDQAVKNAFERWKAYAADAAAYINYAMSGIMAGESGGGGGEYGYGRRPRAGRQAGTTGGRPEIFSQPTMIPVAEGRSERVTVQPLYPTGNAAMSLSWSGGPIPVRGEGSLSGANLDALGSNLTIAIVGRMTKAYESMYPPAGG